MTQDEILSEIQALREQLSTLQAKTLDIQNEMLALREEVIFLRGFQKGVMAIKSQEKT